MSTISNIQNTANSAQTSSIRDGRVEADTQSFQGVMDQAAQTGQPGQKIVEEVTDRQALKEQLVPAIEILAANNNRAISIANRATNLVVNRDMSVEKALTIAMPKAMQNSLKPEGQKELAELLESYSREEILNEYKKQEAQNEVMS